MKKTKPRACGNRTILAQLQLSNHASNLLMTSRESGPPLSRQPNVVPQICDAHCSGPDVRVPCAMRRYGFRAAMLSTWCANVLQTTCSLSRFGLWRNRERRAGGFQRLPGLSPAAATSPRPAGLWIIRWRWPVWWSALHACLRGCGESLSGQTLPPGLRAIFLRAYLSALVRVCLVLA